MKISTIHMVVALLFGCPTTQGEAPQRPENVTEAAEWYGGADGGAWLVVGKARSENHFNVEVYSDYDGRTFVIGDFKLNPECSNEKIYAVDEIRDSIAAWTGERVILTITGRNDRLCFLVSVQE